MCAVPPRGQHRLLLEVTRLKTVQGRCHGGGAQRARLATLVRCDLVLEVRRVHDQAAQSAQA